MKFCILTSSLMGLALASPVENNIFRRYANNGSFVGPEALASCEQASNCEIRHTPEGRLYIDFVHGKGPGSRDYEDRVKNRIKRSVWKRFGFWKRDDEMQTNIAVGKGRVNYGWLTPSDALNALVDQGSCGDAMCTDTVNVGTDIVNGPCIGPTYVILEPYASYSNGDRDNWLSAMKEVFSHEVETKWVDWTGSGDPNTNLCGSGTNPENYQANFIGMNRFWVSEGGKKKDLQGFFQVKISNAQNEDCGKATAAIGAAIGYINGIAGGFFGAIVGQYCSDFINS